MARHKNHVDGTLDETRSGWSSRRGKRRQRVRQSEDVRRMGAEARAGLLATLRGEAVEDGVSFNPEVQTTAPAPGEDFVSQMSDADLVALYKQLHEGRAPNGKAKRPAVERAVRAKQAERAAAQAAEPVAAEPVGEGNTELTLEQLADDAEGDDV